MKIEDDRREALRIKMGMLKWVSYQIIVFIFFSRFSTKIQIIYFHNSDINYNFSFLVYSSSLYYKNLLQE